MMMKIKRRRVRVHAPQHSSARMGTPSGDAPLEEPARESRIVHYNNIMTLYKAQC